MGLTVADLADVPHLAAVASACPMAVGRRGGPLGPDGFGDQPATHLRRAGPIYTGKALAIDHYAQTTNYYCGPASGKDDPEVPRRWPSAADATAQTQANIANATHMRTDINGATQWTSGRFRIGLNQWRQGSNTGFYNDTATPTPTQFRNALGLDVDNNVPFGADTVEFVNGYHYNGHPNQTIGHWIVVGGYVQSKDETRFLDPSTSVWSGVQPSFYASTNIFVNRYLQSNGITW